MRVARDKVEVHVFRVKISLSVGFGVRVGSDESGEKRDNESKTHDGERQPPPLLI